MPDKIIKNYRQIGVYDVGPHLSRSTLWLVRLVVDTRDGQFYIMKSIKTQDYFDRQWFDSKEFKQYVVATKQLQFDHVVRLVTVLQTEHHIHFVTEFAKGGSLMSYTLFRPLSEFTPQGYLCENEARFYFQQLMFAVKYAHSCNEYFHGDLRIDDLLLDGPLPKAYAPITPRSYSSLPKLKVNGFGSARLRLHGRVQPRVFCGEHHYTAPELLFSKGTTLTGQALMKADIWSCGVILYVLVCGRHPFYMERTGAAGGLSHVDDGVSSDGNDDDVQLSEDNKRLIDAIDGGEFVFPEFLSRGVRGVRHLIATMLVPDPAKRTTIEQIMQHPWFDFHVDRRLRKHFDQSIQQWSSAQHSSPENHNLQTKELPAHGAPVVSFSPRGGEERLLFSSVSQGSLRGDAALGEAEQSLMML
jgi:serine/threonine protein kinase